MIDAEKLLGKLVREVTGSNYGKQSKKKYKKRKGHSNPLVSNLKSGAGLMTAIGLGIGAYEILKSKSQQPPTTGGYAPPQPGQQMHTPPPPPPPPAQHTPPPPPPPSAAVQEVPESPQQPQVTLHHITTEELATRLIQTMIAAAHADGTLDEYEEKAILDRLKAAELSQEERMFLLTEMHAPKTIEELTTGISDPAAAQAMYMIAISAIEIDTEEERSWLDQLAGKLGLTKSMQQFIEESD